jgi:hypothetical protein
LHTLNQNYSSSRGFELKKLNLCIGAVLSSIIFRLDPSLCGLTTAILLQSLRDRVQSGISFTFSRKKFDQNLANSVSFCCLVNDFPFSAAKVVNICTKKKVCFLCKFKRIINLVNFLSTLFLLYTNVAFSPKFSHTMIGKVISLYHGNITSVCQLQLCSGSALHSHSEIRPTASMVLVSSGSNLREKSIGRCCR